MPNTTYECDRRAFDFLLQGYRASRGQPAEDRWCWLMAAHVLGQRRLTLHWRSHVAMLRFAASRRDTGEVVGQLARLAMVPFGHALRRLPAGNHGRATDSAFVAMPPDPRLAPLIAEADTYASASATA